MSSCKIERIVKSWNICVAYEVLCNVCFMNLIYITRIINLVCSYACEWVSIVKKLYSHGPSMLHSESGRPSQESAFSMAGRVGGLKV